MVLATSVAACAQPAAPASGPALPPQGGAVDYQLGGAYPPPPGTAIVVRDRTAEPAAGAYAICYVNAFQTQPGERDDWPDDLLLRRDGALVADENWPDEYLVDTRGEARQNALVARVGSWIDGCAAAGSDAVEFDNLDSYSRSDGMLTLDDAVAVARRLVARAHEAGLADGQKNAAEQALRLRTEAGFDFAVAEECAQFDECSAYAHAYGGHVIDIEYTDAQQVPFAAACAAADRPRSMVLRDRELVRSGAAGYVYERCPMDGTADATALP